MNSYAAAATFSGSASVSSRTAPRPTRSRERDGFDATGGARRSGAAGSAHRVGKLIGVEEIATTQLVETLAVGP